LQSNCQTSKVVIMTLHEIRKRFLNFFTARDHAVLPSAPLIPAGDSAGKNVTLFNVAGMQPLMPYLLGEVHPEGKRLVDAQLCIRTVDIDEVGDNTHATMFEMLGNWSLGDYFKEEAIQWSYEFLTSKEEGLGLDPSRLYVTVFAGNDDVPRDNEAVEIWKQYIPEHRIYYRDSKDNWWTAGADSPAGPSTEMFYDLTENGLGDMTSEEFEAADERQDVVEIWNDVFMAYRQEGGRVVGELPNQNVDTGSGLERLAAVMQKKNSIFETDAFMPLIDALGIRQTKEARIIADHMKAATFLAAEGLEPANTDRGYILRRLIRRAAAHAKRKDVLEKLGRLVEVVVTMYAKAYPHVEQNKSQAQKTISDEIDRFAKVLDKGLREFEKGERDAFVLFTTYGFPLEMTIELAEEKGEKIDVDQFNKKMEEHQSLSRAGAEQKFKGGLADDSEETVKLHTAHHLLLAALQKVVDPEIKQRGSNITSERMRMDFSFDRKLTDEEKQAVQDLVNEKIQAGLSVVRREMPLEDAEQIGAQMEFGTKYPEMVSVYFIEGTDGEVFSKEFCGGPHVSNTNQLGTFVIKKEKASSAGVRRIKAVLE